MSKEFVDEFLEKFRNEKIHQYKDEFFVVTLVYDEEFNITSGIKFLQILASKLEILTWLKTPTEYNIYIHSRDARKFFAYLNKYVKNM